ncbi:MAG: gliding motility-associated ABC transporter substrate-binding protein GldG [Bacteroidales bacterium]|nr:gliding motility-associated ABC transporter substrate-binding protein GldG [Bacteroidales bacterium]
MSVSGNIKIKNIKTFAALLLMLIVVNVLSSFFYFRIDLTEDKRYTIQPATREVLKGLDDIVVIRVYLDGELPVAFIRMKKALAETLSEFQEIAGKKIRYEFVNPYSASGAKKQEQLFRQLADKGLVPTNVHVKDSEGAMIQRIIFPGCIITYRGKELAVNLLRNNPNLTGDENINLSIQNFEYALVDAIDRVTTENRQSIAFIQGHGELDEFETGDIERELNQYYEVSRVIINGDPDALKPYKTIIIAGPSRPMPEADKLIIDQFIMQGGRVLWLVDPVSVSIDSLSSGASTLAFMNQHNLDDMLFRYGVRLNPLLIQDIQCAVIPVNTALVGQEPRFVPAPWLYYPLLLPPADNPITKGLNLIQAKFISPIDTVGMNDEVKKRILLSTSKETKLVKIPALINLNQVSKGITRYEFQYSMLPVAVELQGIFKSNFRNRPINAILPNGTIKFADKSSFTKMIVVADADIIRNDVQRRPNGAYVIPLGYDRFTQQTYGNKELVVNMVKYLCDDNGLLDLRSRDIKLRLLDRKRAISERLYWQLVNMVLPSLMLVVAGIIWNFVRRKKYTFTDVK